MDLVNRDTALKWLARVVVAIFFVGISVRILLGRLDEPLHDSYVLWWDPVGYACLVGMGAFGFARRVRQKRELRETNSRQDGS